MSRTARAQDQRFGSISAQPSRRSRKYCRVRQISTRMQPPRFSARFVVHHQPTRTSQEDAPLKDRPHSVGIARKQRREHRTNMARTRRGQTHSVERNRLIRLDLTANPIQLLMNVERKGAGSYEQETRSDADDQ